MTEREVLAAKVSFLRQKGLTVKQAAVELGLTYSQASDVVNDPDGAKAKARKDSYRGTCAECGGPTDGSHGKDGAPGRCKWCVRGIPMNDRRRPQQPSLRRCHPVRLVDLPLDVRVAAARAAIRLEKFEAHKLELLDAAFNPSETTYWIAEAPEKSIKSLLAKEAA